MKIVGIDPGYANLGIAVLDTGRRLRFARGQLVKTKPTERYENRERDCIEALRDNIDGAAAVGMERQDFVFAGQGKKKKASLESERVRRICGAVSALATLQRANLVEPTPKQMRSVLGLPQGASKQQVAQMLARIIGEFPFPCSDHLSDAAAAAYFAYRAMGGLRELTRSSGVQWR